MVDLILFPSSFFNITKGDDIKSFGFLWISFYMLHSRKDVDQSFSLSCFLDKFLNTIIF